MAISVVLHLCFVSQQNLICDHHFFFTNFQTPEKQPPHNCDVTIKIFVIYIMAIFHVVILGYICMWNCFTMQHGKFCLFLSRQFGYDLQHFFFASFMANLQHKACQFFLVEANSGQCPSFVDIIYMRIKMFAQGPFW